MTTGTIKFFDTEKEFGFIVPTDGSVDIFVHKTGLNEVVRADDAVSFTVKQGQKALEAVNVSKIQPYGRIVLEKVNRTIVLDSWLLKNSEVIMMKHYQHILCLTDFSPASEKALNRADWLRDVTGAKLTLAHFFQIITAPYAMGVINVDPQLFEKVKLHAEKTLTAHGLTNVTMVLEDKTVRTGITELLATSNIDLIVVGRHGSHSLSEKLLGSTSHYVINHATCDVMVVHEPTKHKPVGGNNPIV